jgi:hypothetical protein
VLYTPVRVEHPIWKCFFDSDMIALYDERTLYLLFDSSAAHLRD